MQAGAAIARDVLLLGETLDYASEHGYEISFVSGYAPTQLPDDPWRVRAYENWLVVSVASFAGFDLRCVLAREGQVRLYGPGGKPDHSYQIPEAGVFGEAAIGLGYVNRIRAVGDALFVCGQSRQVYRFECKGKDLAKGAWVDMAGAMRQPPMPEPPGSADEEAFNAWLDEHEAIDLVDINGPSVDDLYAVGDEAWHWDGKAWRQLELPTDEPLAAIKLLKPNELVMVGHNGTLLHGHATTGFTDLSGVDDNQNFTGVEWFETPAFPGRLFMASNFGLFTYNATSKRIERYTTGLQPELQDSHQLEAKDGVLWSFGFKDLAYFDGQRWIRVDHPDNPPIR
jgi:hypothetical protein